MNVDDILEILNIDLIGIVPDDQDIIVSTNKGEPAVVNPKSIAGQGYRNITERLNGNNVPLMDLDENTFFGRIKKLFGKKQ